MAYAALVSLSQTIPKLLRDQDRYPISRFEKQLIISIRENVIFFQAFLEDYADKASCLEGRLRDAANEAEDVIEDFMWEQLHQQNYTSVTIGGPEFSPTISHLSGMSSEGKQIVDWQNYTSESTAEPESTIEVSDLTGTCLDFTILRKVADAMESIAVEVMEVKNNARTKDVQQHTNSASAATPSSRLIIGSTSSKLETATVGFEDALIAIKGRLCGESRNLQVIPIYGMGGIGKTTLAKSAYDDQLIVEHFQIRAWVTVSQDYSRLEILSSLVVSVGAECSQERDESKMSEIVYKSLKGRRYLIVMDDIWCTEAWQDVRRICPDDCNSSRIVLTTRLLEVAVYAESRSPPFEMHFMDLDQSWDLLLKKVFPRGKCPPELEDIGKTIAGSCRGLPLAIVVIGGLLSTVSQTPSSWENIASNVNDAITTNDEEFAEIVLSLSYNHLPHHLRPCFLYMGGFPEDYEIRVSRLIKLWVAEGFLKLPNGSKSCEEVAEEYLEDLIERSLVLVTRRKSNGKIKSCSVHDLVRDLCVRKAQQEKFLVCIKDSRAPEERVWNQRRVFIAGYANRNSPENVYGSHTHTILCTKRRDHGHNACTWDTFCNIRLLRVLDVAHDFSSFRSFFQPHHEIGIFHLRHLALSHMVDIPEAISSLENLQTLIIYQEHRYASTIKSGIRLPQVWRMQELRHLVTSSYFELPDPERALDPLENLETLSHVLDFTCTLEILRMIPNLKKLGISYPGDKYNGEAHLENLVYLRKLEKLTLETERETFKKFKRKPFGKLNPVFPPTLKKLTLSGKQCSWKDMGNMIGSLPKLEVLKLRDYACFGDKWQTGGGEFPKLKFLLISGSGLRCWITESSHFPSLKSLVLRSCWDLVEIPDDIGEIPTLELIEIDKGNEPLVGSAKRIQEEQQEHWGNDSLQIHCV